MRILITGAEGAIGKKLVSRLKGSNHKITILSRSGENLLSDSHVAIVIGDLLLIKSLKKATENIDLVIHLAGITHTNNEQLYYDVNTKGTENLINACIKNKVKRFIYISTRAASIESGAYGHSKLLAEKEVKKSGLGWVILRPSEVYGAGEKEAITRLIKTVQKSFFIPVIGSGKYTLAPVYVEDVIFAIIASISSKISKKKYIIAGPDEITYNDLIDRISKYLGVRRIKVHIPINILKIVLSILSAFNINILVRDQIPRLICNKLSDIKQTSKDLKFFPINFDEGIRIIMQRDR